MTETTLGAGDRPESSTSRFTLVMDRGPWKTVIGFFGAALLAAMGSCGLGPATIRMVGVWDTVGSLGIPALFGNVDPIRYGFLSPSLHPDIKNAVQALAIDERRQQFPPTLWTTQAPGQNVDQVWFTGVHGDVGGGYPPDQDGTELSEITFAWMLSKIAGLGELGLTIAPEVLAKYRLPVDAGIALKTKHESWSPEWLLPKHRDIDAEATLADSVAFRCANDATYRPPNLNFSNGALSSEYPLENVVQTQAAAAG